MTREIPPTDGALRPPPAPSGTPLAPPRAQPDEVTLVPHGHGGERVLGAYVRSGDTVRFRPAYDANRLAVAGVAALAIVTAGAVAGVVAVTRRRGRPAVGSVTMGPGGWVSVRNAPSLRAGTAHRPWWARLLRARRLVVER